MVQVDTSNTAVNETATSSRRTKNFFSYSQSIFSTFKFLLSITVLLFAVVLFQSSGASAQQPSAEDDFDRCSPNKTKERRLCREGILLPLWPPANTSLISTGEKAGRAIVFFLALIYLFLGVSIIADRFMASIEVITSKEKEVVIRAKDGTEMVTSVRIWNETVSNLTLMALGSSAPEIMLSIIEICGRGFHAGDLGPSTIVGSASFNLFIIIGICMYVIPDGEVRKIKHPRVFFVTASWSILAYVWLYIILAVSSYGVVEIWEGVVTFLFFPILVVFAWIADRRLLLYKLMYKRYRSRRKNLIVETEGEPRRNEGEKSKSNEVGEVCLHLTEMGENGRAVTEEDSLSDESYESLNDEEQQIIDSENSRKKTIALMRDIRKKNPDADMNEVARLASAEVLNHQPKSRAFYRIQATRKLTGAGDILNKGKAEHFQSIQSLDKLEEGDDDDDDEVTKVYFEPDNYRVMENCGFVELFVMRRGGDLRRTLFVDYKTEDGTANAGSDYVSTEDTIVFRSGETVKKIKIEILDDDIFEEDEFFTVQLQNVRLGTAEGMFDTEEDSTKIVLETPHIANVIILDDDHAGIFSFASDTLKVSESVGVLKVEVQRNSGARGKVTVPYRTISGTAKGNGIDYVDVSGELEFENDETTQEIAVQIIDDENYEKNQSFSLMLSAPKLFGDKSSSKSDADTGSDSGINGHDDRPMLTEQEEEERRIAELGKPRLGQHPLIEITIEESYEFKSTVDKLIKKANLAMIIGTSSWREQFVDAIAVNGGSDDGGDNKKSSPSTLDYVMHFLTVFWKIAFAFVPPTDYFGGWACFFVSILVIGMLTAIINDVASQFGCIVDLNDAVTAVTLVAMGTSVPDTFASKVAAIGDQYADASIGNVTGSNAVNVFLGIGIAWTVAAIYWAVTGRTPEEKKFYVPPSNLAFSVTIFSAFACIAIAILMYRRRSPKIQAELGGPRKSKIVGSCIFFLLWLIYIILSALDSYCIIKTF